MSTESTRDYCADSRPGRRPDPTETEIRVDTVEDEEGHVSSPVYRFGSTESTPTPVDLQDSTPRPYLYFPRVRDGSPTGSTTTVRPLPSSSSRHGRRFPSRRVRISGSYIVTGQKSVSSCVGTVQKDRRRIWTAPSATQSLPKELYRIGGIRGATTCRVEGLSRGWGTSVRRGPRGSGGLRRRKV